MAIGLAHCVLALGGIATTVRSSFRLKSVSNPRKAVKVLFIPRNPMNYDTPTFNVLENGSHYFITDESSPA